MKNVILVYVLLLVIFSFISRAIPLNVFGIFDELVLLMFVPLLFNSKIKLIKHRVSFVLLYLLFTSFSLLSIDAKLLQYILDLKFIACLIIGLYLKNKVSEFEVDLILGFIIIFNALVLLFEFTFPEVYQSNLTGDYNALFHFGSDSYYRANGVFAHPGELALFSTIALVWFSFKSEKKYNDVAAVFISIVTLILTFQRAEILAFLCVYVLYRFRKLPRFNRFLPNAATNSQLGVLYILAMFLLFYFVFMLFSNEVNTAKDSARLALYKGSVLLLFQSPFFGIGPGLFGSHLSTDGSWAYEFLNFHIYWWFNEGRYITDTFWPKILAEYGVVGLLGWLYILKKVLVTTSLNKGTSIVILIFITSLQAPIFFNTKLILIALLVAYAKYNNSRP